MDDSSLLTKSGPATFHWTFLDMNQFFSFEKRDVPHRRPNEVVEAIIADDPDKLIGLVAEYGDTRIQLLFEQNFELFSKDPNILNYAAFFGSVKCFKALINFEISFQSCESDFLFARALEFAAAGNCVEILKLLPYQSCIFAIVDRAAVFGSVDILRFLLVQGFLLIWEPSDFDQMMYEMWIVNSTVSLFQERLEAFLKNSCHCS